MKRFVTYLYEYEQGMKGKNVGFIRVDVRSNVINMEISVRKIHVQNEKAQLVGIVVFDGLQGLQLGEIELVDGQGDARLQLPVRNLLGKPVSIDDVAGVGICLESGNYIASCWKDDYADAIARAEYRPWEDSPVKEISVVKNVEAVSDAEHAEQVNNIKVATIDIENTAYIEEGGKDPTQYCYRKLDLTYMHILPTQDRHYMNNAFLMHGFWNYGYVVLKTEITGNDKKSWLGVPGIYERPEATMAMAFGFPLFEAIPQEMVEAPINVEKCFTEKEIRDRSFQVNTTEGKIKNQPSRDVLFGCWFVELHM